MQMPPVTRTKSGGIAWTPELLDWLQTEIAAGTTIKALAGQIGCSTQSIHSCCNKHSIARPVQGTERPENRDEFAALMGGKRFEDVLLRRVETPRPLGAPVGPLTRLTRPRPIGRALDLGGV